MMQTQIGISPDSPVKKKLQGCMSDVLRLIFPDLQCCDLRIILFKGLVQFTRIPERHT